MTATTILKKMKLVKTKCCYYCLMTNVNKTF